MLLASTVVALAVLAPTLGPQEPGRSAREALPTLTVPSGPVLRRDALAEARAAYADPSASVGAPGELFVLDPSGEPVEGASVALVEGKGAWGGLEVLDVVVTGADGLAELPSLPRADQIAVWADGFPASRIDGKLLALHRELAGRGAMLVRLDPSDVVAGKVTIDGVPASEPIQLRFLFPWSMPNWPALRQGLGRVLEAWSPPGAFQLARVERGGGFRMDGFRWPFSSGRDVLPGELRWTEEDLFPADSSLALGSTRSSLHGYRVTTRGVPIELRLTRGGFVEGRVVSQGGEPLGSGMELRFALPGEEERMEVAPIAEDGSFRFALPLPFPDLELELRSGADSVADAQVFSFDAPGPARGLRWDVGTLVYHSEHTRLLLVRDAQGAAIAGAGAEIRSETATEDLPPRPTEPGWRAHLSNAEGRLLAALPAPGERLVVTHPLYEPADMGRPGAGSGPREVVLQRSAVLHLRARLPEGLPAARVLVQLEAVRPALRLYRGERTSYDREARARIEGPLAERLVDAHSRAPWSFTKSFKTEPRGGETSAAPEEARLLDLRGLTPGLPFHLTVFTPSGGLFLDEEVPGFLPGEERTIEVALRGDPVSVSGVVLLASGRPARGVNLHFGSRALSYVATTDAHGRFRIDGLSSLQGPLLVERTSIWNACFDGGGTSGRDMSALLLDEGFHFESQHETLLRLPEREFLEIQVVDPEGAASKLAWRVDLFDGAGTIPLTLTSQFEDRNWGEGGPCMRERPAGTPATVALTYQGSEFRRFVPAGESSVEIPTPAAGKVEVLTRPVGEGQAACWYRFTHRASGAMFARDSTGSGRDLLEGFLPGTYLVELRRYDGADDDVPLPLRSVEVTVRPGEIAHLSLR